MWDGASWVIHNETFGGNFSISPGILRDGASSHPWNSRESGPGTAISVSPPPGLIEKLLKCRCTVWRKTKDFGHALKRGKIARNRRNLRASRREVFGHPSSSALSVQFFPNRGVTPNWTSASSPAFSLSLIVYGAPTIITGAPSLPQKSPWSKTPPR